MTESTKNIDIEEYENEVYENPGEFEETNEAPPPVEKAKRTKKDRSPAQLKAFEKCLAMRKKRAEEQFALRGEKAAEMQTIDEQVEEHIHKVKKKRPVKKKVVIQESSSDDEPEVIYIKKHKKRKPKKKRIVIDESSSSDDEIRIKDYRPREPKQVEKQSSINKAKAKEEEEEEEQVAEEQQPKYVNKLMLMKSLGF